MTSLVELVGVAAPEDTVRERLHGIHHDLMAHSAYVKIPDFTAIHPSDLAFLFDAYDHTFFSNLCRRTLDGRRLDFRLSRRMTSAGGRTTRIQSYATGAVHFEISIASSMLFDGFRDADRDVTVCGVACYNRLEALQRIFEHELVHLIEQLCWGDSDCKAARFQSIAQGCFLHRSHTHALITRRERAVNAGFRVGSMVSFTFEGVRLTGRLNRITKRATVLVEDAAGHTFSDGQRYKVFYVPLGCLELLSGTDS